jgi:hypothetical protein
VYLTPGIVLGRFYFWSPAVILDRRRIRDCGDVIPSLKPNRRLLDTFSFLKSDTEGELAKI